MISIIFFCLLLFPHICASSDEQNTYVYNSNVGSYTGICTCFNGQKYSVGDLSNNCKTMACYGDGAVASDCKTPSQPGYNPAGVGMQVTLFIICCSSSCQMDV